VPPSSSTSGHRGADLAGFAPIFEAASEQHPEIVFGKVDTEAEFELAGSFGIRSIPTLMVYRDQIIVFSQPGAFQLRRSRA